MSGRSSENSSMHSEALSSSFLRTTTAESCDQEGWMVSGSRVLLLFIAWRPADSADWPPNSIDCISTKKATRSSCSTMLIWNNTLSEYSNRYRFLFVNGFNPQTQHSREQVLDLKVSNDWCTREYDYAHHNLARCSPVVSLLKHLECLRSSDVNSDVYHVYTTRTNQFGSNLIVIMLWTTFVSSNEVEEYNPKAIHITLLGGTSISANCFRIHISRRSAPDTRLSSYGFDSRNLQNKPKEQPNSNDTINLFLSSGGVGASTIHATPSSVGDWEEHSKKPFWSNSHLFQTTAGDWETNVGGTLHTTFSKAIATGPKNPRRQICQFAPRPPKDNAVGEKIPQKQKI